MPVPSCRSRITRLLLVGGLAFACVAGEALVDAPDAHAQRVYRRYGPPPRARARYWDRDPETPYETVLAIDAEGAVPVNMPRFASGSTLSGGAGFKARIGEQLRAGYGVHVTPEIGYGYDRLFASSTTGTAYGWDASRVFGGVRLAFGHIVQPVVYGHMGYGWRDTSDPTVPDQSGLAWDVGGALDLHVAPRFVLGAHLEYDQMDTPAYSPQWLGVGAHAQFLF